MCYNKVVKDKKFYLELSILITIALFLIISVFLNAHFITALDNFVYTLIHYIRFPFTNNIFLIITLFGQTLTIVLVLYALWFFPNRKRLALPLTLCMFFSSGINAVIKLLVNRARPVGEFVGNLFFNYGFPTSSSFPSGHSQAGVVFYYVLITILINELNISNKKIRIGLKISAITLAILIGISRIVLGVHFFTDVLTGLIIGWIVVIVFQKIYKKILHHKNLQNSIK